MLPVRLQPSRVFFCLCRACFACLFCFFLQACVSGLLVFFCVARVSLVRAYVFFLLVRRLCPCGSPSPIPINNRYFETATARLTAAILPYTRTVGYLYANARSSLYTMVALGASYRGLQFRF